MREDESAAVGLELEERAAVQPQRFNDLPLGGLDFGIHLVGRQVDESCGHVGHEADGRNGFDMRGASGDDSCISEDLR
jgi:hypothetical protein